ncbi:hypothetical protein HDU99_010098, partial [Rhizoclosmatium hyalinum]
ALENQNIPFEKVVSSVQPKTLPGRHPLYSFAVLEQISDVNFEQEPSAGLGPLDFYLQYAYNDFGILEAFVYYDSSLFLESTIFGMTEQIKSLLEMAMDNSSVSILTPFVRAIDTHVHVSVVITESVE